MARSHYIYVVVDDFGMPLAAFTVKYECKRVLQEIILQADKVWTFSDGARGKPPTAVDAKEFLDGSAPQQK